MSGISLLELTRQIKTHLDRQFLGRPVWVIAEVTNLKYYDSKKYYFLELIQKDENGTGIVAKMGASIFAQGTQRVQRFEQVTGRKFENNLRVLIQVDVDFHVQYGLKLNIRDIDPNYTLGELEKQRRETLERLLRFHPLVVRVTEGVYDTINRRIPLPAAIQHIAIVTSQVSDGYSDFLDELTRNSYGYHFELTPYYTRVQGAEAGKVIAAKIHEINTSGKKFDVIVIIRGGGSQVDFMAFDDFDAALAVAGSAIPVFSGIGHLKNESIVDMMANRALKTPTKVAEVILSHNRSFEEGILEAWRSVRNAGERLFSVSREHLTAQRTEIYSLTKALLDTEKIRLENRAGFFREGIRIILAKKTANLLNIAGRIRHLPEQVFGAERMKLSWVTSNMKAGTRSIIKNKHDQLKHHRSLIRMSSPESILRRGFALVYQHDKIITDPSAIKEQSVIEVYLGGENITSTVTQKKKDNEQRFKL